MAKTKNAMYRQIGASNHVEEEREENDYYATEPKALELLLKLESFNPTIWECACGEGHLSEVLWANGYYVQSSDIVDRGYGEGGIDFLKSVEMFNGDIITNPPYKYAQQFAEHALSLIPTGNKVALFLRLLFLEGQARRKFFEQAPPCRIYVASGRLQCAKNGMFGGGSVAAYAWFIWEKGYTGPPKILWFN